MCGIVGFTGNRNAMTAVIQGLSGLEYRGYDSAGIAWVADARLAVKKTAGRVDDLAKILPVAHPSLAIGHTRWATHGAPDETNAHPHLSPDGKIAIVHNGIVDNYLALKQTLGEAFLSDTDSEVVAHLIAREYRGDLLAAVEKVLPLLDGTYALAVIAADQPDLLIAARKGSPLVVGIADDATLVASDVVPILPYTKEVVYLDDGQVVVCRGKSARFRAAGREIEVATTTIDWSVEAAQKGGYPHFMLKEIFEQPAALRNLVHHRVKIENNAPAFNLEGIELPTDYFRGVGRIVLIAQGTAYHAAMIGRNLIERTALIPSYAEYAADFHYRDPLLDPSVLVIALTQSGETMDTLQGVRKARDAGCKVVAVVNTVGSTIAREADGVFYMHCGPEIGVASTKAFTAMVASLYILSLRMAQMRRTLDPAEIMRRTLDLAQVGPRLEAVLSTANYIRQIAGRYAEAKNFLFLGRGTGWPLAMEGALKLKEVSYIHAEGYDAAEMKHGPIALIDENMPCLFIALLGRRYGKVRSNIQEVRARRGRVIAIASHNDDQIHEVVDDVIYVRAESGVMNSLVCAVPLQLLAYYIAAAKNCDVDKPRGLAKSVTVE
ncbi:glutamine--fructose-6-phosphate aminotransferase [isomerizing] [Planctomycetales bacterium]|nr:glutamine--fructose-6-phosphate aminotransferase [isomerizing] [Planctomycetales bacterium]